MLIEVSFNLFLGCSSLLLLDDELLLLEDVDEFFDPFFLSFFPSLFYLFYFILSSEFYFFIFFDYHYQKKLCMKKIAKAPSAEAVYLLIFSYELYNASPAVSQFYLIFFKESNSQLG